ncbi:MAG: UDP-N-acetylmuramate dehydrogenase [Cytophagaceae bacterium]
MDLKENFSLRSYNTFGIDVTTDFYGEFETEDKLCELISGLSSGHYPIFVLGGGSNVLFTQNFKGTILRNNIKGIRILEDESDHCLVKAGAGEVWNDFVCHLIEKNLAGLENLSLIPGTVGAAPIQNIGAYGVEQKDCFQYLEAIEIDTLKKVKFNYEECRFGYRDSIFKSIHKEKYIITYVVYRLSKIPHLNTTYGAIADTLKEMGISNPDIKSVSEAVCKIRRSKLPDPKNIGNAGSFFKNPEISETAFQILKQSYTNIPSFQASQGKVKVPAGWLIEQCGWKGKTFGNYGVHKNQALVLVNYGGADGNQIKELAYAIRQSVLEKFSIILEPEVNIV